MRAAEALIEQIVASSQIPSGKRRREVARELRAHIEDFVLVARGSGQADDDIERMVVANFGDPRQIGGSFAWVYRRERVVARLAVFGLCTMAVASSIAAAILAMQAGAAAGFGNSPLRLLGSRHTMIEAMDILATAAAYVGFISLERLFERRRFLKAFAWLSVAMGGLASAGIGASFVIFGFASAVFLRTVRELLAGWTARLSAVVAGFGMFGMVFWLRLPARSYSIAASLASWLIMGVGYQMMTGLAARLDRDLSRRFLC